MSCFQDCVAPELGSKHPLKDLQHVPHGRGHPVVRLLEQDDKHVQVSEVVLEPIDHGVNMLSLISTMTTITEVFIQTVNLHNVVSKPWSVYHSKLCV